MIVSQLGDWRFDSRSPQSACQSVTEQDAESRVVSSGQASIITGVCMQIVMALQLAALVKLSLVEILCTEDKFLVCVKHTWSIIVI